MRAVALLAAVMLLGASSGCASSTTPDSDVVGDWRLATIDGRLTPAPVRLPIGVSVYVREGTLTFRADGTYESTRMLSYEPAGTGFMAQQTGTYSVDGRIIQLQTSASVVNDGVVGARAVTLRSGGRHYRYER